MSSAHHVTLQIQTTPPVSQPVSYLEYGPTDKPVTILLLHANPGDARDFDAVHEPFSKDQQQHVVALNWPGFGEDYKQCECKSPNGGSAEYFFRCLESFVASAPVMTSSSTSKLCLIGNSVGGNAAVHFAAMHPERVSCLILVSPGGYTPQNPIIRFACRHVMANAWLAPAPITFAKFYTKNKKANRFIEEVLSRNDKLHSDPATMKLVREVWYSFAGDFNDLRGATSEAVVAKAIPTLLVFGKHDPVIGPADAAQARKSLPHAEFVSMDTGHLCFAERPQEFSEVALKFLKGKAEGM